jgi:hypothetical protein
MKNSTITEYNGRKITVCQRGNLYRGFVDEVGRTWGETEAEAFDKGIELIDDGQTETRFCASSRDARPDDGRQCS